MSEQRQGKCAGRKFSCNIRWIWDVPPGPPLKRAYCPKCRDPLKRTTAGSYLPAFKVRDGRRLRVDWDGKRLEVARAPGVIASAPAECERADRP